MSDPAYYPAIGSLVPFEKLPQELGMLRDAFQPLLAHLFYKDLYLASTPAGDAAHYDLTLVWYKRLELEVPGTDGLALVAFPSQDGGAAMELPISAAYRLDILRFKPYFDGTIPADPQAWFDLLMEILGVDPLELLLETVSVLVEGADPLEEFVASSGRGLLTLSDAPDVDVYVDLIEQMEALDLDLSQIILEDYIAPAADKLERITALFGAWLGEIDPLELLALVIPRVEFELRQVEFALTFPRGWLKPLDDNDQVIDNPAVRSALTFNVGRFRFSTVDGLQLQQQGDFNFRKSVILDTGFTLSLDNAVVDISQTANIAPADADDRPPDFIGFYAQEATLGLPVGWFEDPDGTTAELFGSNVLIGTGGVSGEFGIRATAPTIVDPVLNFRLGGENGLAIGMRHFRMRIHQNTFELAELAGQISIPGVVDEHGQPAALDLLATIDEAGVLHAAVNGQMYLGNGIWLYPVGDNPLLSLDLDPGPTTEFYFQVRALFQLPGDDAPQVEVSGHLHASINLGGQLILTTFEAKTEADNLGWTLPGDLSIDALTLAIGYDGTSFYSLVGGTLLLDPFDLSARSFLARLEVNAGGFDLNVIEGQLRLPESFGPGATGEEPSVSIASYPLSISYRATNLTFDGALQFTDFGISTGGIDGFEVHLQKALLFLPSIEITPAGIVADLPLLVEVNGTIQIPTSSEPAILSFTDVQWGFDGLPTGTLALAETVSIPISDPDAAGERFSLEIVGGLRVDNMPSTGITVTRTLDITEITVNGDMGMTIPAGVLTGVGGDRVPLVGAGTIMYRLGDLLPTFSVSKMGVEDATLHLGGENGVAIEKASLIAQQVENLFNPAEDKPFTLAMSGGLGISGDAGPKLDIQGIELRFIGQPLPVLKIPDELSLQPGANTLELLDNVPVRLKKATIAFAETDTVISEVLKPDNISLTLSGEMELPIPPDASVSGFVDNIIIRFNELGLPLPELPEGLGVGVEDMQIATMTLTAMLYMGGLQNPDNLFFAGNAGGMLNGAGITALVALGLDGPRGVCLQVEAGAAGIPLGPSGFLLTGANGGVSFVNSNADPCDFRTYVQLSDDGRPLDNPDPDIDTSTGVPDREPQVLVSSISGNGIPCPTGDCPPPSINIFCERHPDTAQYPDSVIIKFSSLDQTAVDQILAQIGLSPADLSTMTPEAIAGAFAAGVRAWAADLWLDLVPPNLASLREEVNRKLDVLQTLLTRELVEQLEGALGGSIYEALLSAAYAGVPCIDNTVKLTGTFSYTGVSTFLNVNGGFLLSSAGSAGVLGSVNLLGIPVGTLEGYITITDANGDPNPSLCGEIRAALGPLEFGSLRFVYECQGCMTGVLEGLALFGTHLSAAFIDHMIKVAAPSIHSHPDYDVNEPLALLLQVDHAAEAVAFIGRFLSLQTEQLLKFAAQIGEPDIVVKVIDCLVDLYVHAWDSFNPKISLCGQAQPRLFGLPLASELVAIRSYVEKGPEHVEYLAAFGFSPTYLLSAAFNIPVPAGIDQAIVGNALRLPDPGHLIRQGITGQFTNADDLRAYVEQGFEYALNNAVITASYEIAPFGFRLALAQGRFIMPRLNDHPSAPANGGWTSPDNAAGLPSRKEIIQFLLDAGLLGEPTWIGSASQMDELTQDATAGEYTLIDYFPHGGFLGAGLLEVPKLFTSPVDFQKITEIVSGTDWQQRLTSALDFIQTYILDPERIGELSFYLPAPNPPSFDQAGQLLSPLALSEQMQSFDPAQFDMSHFFDDGIYAHETAFMQTFWRGHLLGIPLQSLNLPLVEPQTGGYFRAQMALEATGWLTWFFDSASADFMLTHPQPEPIDQEFAAVLAATQAMSEEQRVEAIIEALTDLLPKLSMKATIDNLKLPPALAAVFEGSISAQLHAYSPFFAFDPDFTEGDPLQTARNFGGFAISSTGNLEVGKRYGLVASVDDAAFSLAFAPGSALPQISAYLEGAMVRLPFGLGEVNNTTIEFASTGTLNIAGEADGPFTQSDISLALRTGRRTSYLYTQMTLALDLDDQIGPFTLPRSTTRLVDGIVLDTQFTADLELRLIPGSLTARISSGRLSWQGRTWRVPGVITINAGVTSLTEFHNAILAGISSQARRIFTDLFTSPEFWIEALQSGAVLLSNWQNRLDHVAQIIAAFSNDLPAQMRLLNKLYDDLATVIDATLGNLTGDLLALLNHLAGIGYTDTYAISATLFQLYPNDVDKAVVLVQFLHETGKSIPQIVNRLHKANYDPAVAAQALRKLLDQLSIDDMLGEVIRSLIQAYNTTLTLVLSALEETGILGSREIARAVGDFLGGAYAVELARYFFDHYGGGSGWGNIANNIADRLQYGDFTLNEAADALRALRNDLPLGQIIKALMDQYTKSLSDALAALERQGTLGSRNIAEAVKQFLGGAYAVELARYFFDHYGGGSGWGNIANNIADRLQYGDFTLNEAADALRALRNDLPLGQIIKALMDQYTKSLSDALAALERQGTLGSRNIAEAVKQFLGGAYAVELARYFFDHYGGGSGWGNIANNIADRLQYGDFTLNEAADALRALRNDLPLGQIIKALVDQYGKRLIDVLRALERLGRLGSNTISNAAFSAFGEMYANELAQHLFNRYGPLTSWQNNIALKIAQRFFTAGFSQGTTWIALSSVTANNAAAFTVNQITAEINAVFNPF